MKRKIALLLFSVAVLIGAAGCFEEKEPEQIQEPFVPVEPGVRLERHCDILCLNTEDGSLTPLEQLQEKLGKESLDKLAKAAKDKMLDVSAKKEVLPDNYVESINAEVQNRANVSTNILKTNYYSKLEK